MVNTFKFEQSIVSWTDRSYYFVILKKIESVSEFPQHTKEQGMNTEGRGGERNLTSLKIPCDDNTEEDSAEIMLVLELAKSFQPCFPRWIFSVMDWSILTSSSKCFPPVLYTLEYQMLISNNTAISASSLKSCFLKKIQFLVPHYYLTT